MRYDTVEFDHPDGTRKVLAPAEFEALPLLDRVQWISQARFKFLKDGVKIPSYQALKPEKKLMRAGRALLYGAALLWIAAAAGGSLYMFAYESRPAPRSEVAQVWPEQVGLARNAGGFSLVMAVHPKCSCTRASVAELNKLMLGWGGRVHAVALVTKPFELPDLWSESDVTARLREIPNVEVVRDLGGEKASAFGAQNSGHTLLYDASGRLVFDGGITAFRGHEGPSVGGEALKQLVAGTAGASRHSKVFGVR